MWCTQRILLRALDINTELSIKGLRIPFSDVLIAATALETNNELVTLDTRHFTRIPGIRLYTPKSADR